MAIEQLEHRLGKVQNTYNRIGEMIDSPGGSAWPKKYDLQTDPTTPEEGIQFTIRIRGVIPVLDRLKAARETFESRIQTLQDKIAEQKQLEREQLLTEVLDQARQSAERRRVGGVGLTKEIMARVESAARLARQTPAETAPSILPTAPEITSTTPISIPTPPEAAASKPAEEPVPAAEIPSVIPSDSLVAASASEESQNTALDTPPTPDVSREAAPVPPAPSQPDGSTSLADFDLSGLNLSPLKARIYKKVREEHPIDRLKLARSIWPDASSDKAALNRLGNELDGLRTEMRKKGVSIADIAGPNEPRAIYDIVTVEQEDALKLSGRNTRLLRGIRAKKKPEAAASKPADEPEAPALAAQAVQPDLGQTPPQSAPPPAVESQKAPTTVAAPADSGGKKETPFDTLKQRIREIQMQVAHRFLSHMAASSLRTLSIHPAELLINLLPKDLSISQVVLESLPKGSNLPAMITDREIVDFFARSITVAINSLKSKQLSELSAHQRQIYSSLVRLGKSGSFDINDCISMIYEHFKLAVPGKYIGNNADINYVTAPANGPSNSDQQKPIETKEVFKGEILRKPKPNRRGTDRRNSSRVMPKKGGSIKTTINPVIARKAENPKAAKINKRARRFK